MEQRICETCRGELVPSDTGTMCSRCKYAKRPRKPCADCGGPTGWPATDKRAPEKSRCRACQRANPKRVHGAAYGSGCRCDECRAGHREKMRAYATLVRERDGVSIGRKYDKGQKRKTWIAPLARRAIYERDGWICQICFEPVSRTLKNGRLAPSLDHIIPRSAMLIPDHSPSNLRTAHMACNASRGARC